MKKLFIFLVVAAGLGILQTGESKALTKDVLVTTSNPGVKPSMAQAPNGDLYVAAEEYNSSSIDIYRSQNEGRTWSLIDSLVGGQDLVNPSITCTEEWVYVAFEQVISNTSREVKVYRFPTSVGPGIYFTVDSGIYMPEAEHIHPEICTDHLLSSPHNVYVTYETNRIDYYGVFFSRSTDQGATWSTPVEVTGGSENSSWNTRPDIAFGSAGLFITFVKPGWNGSAWINSVWVTKSTTFGTSWSTPVKIGSVVYPCYHPRVAAAIGNQSVLVAYTKEKSADLDVSYSSSTNGGSTWSYDSLPWTGANEKEVELAVSVNQGRFHAAFWQGDNIRYTWADTLDPSNWADTVLVDDYNGVSSIYSRPAICVEPNRPVDQEACFAWTDYRTRYYDVYFDALYLKNGSLPFLLLLLGD